MKNNKLLWLFLSWRLILFLFVIVSPMFFVLQNNFLGGEIANYLKAPWLWAWGNFDGQHYLSIARYGYKPLQYFYFPAYPMLVGFVSRLFSGQLWVYHLNGLLISNIAFYFGLVGLLQLIKLDYKKNLIYPTVLLILFFPTSFYFGSFYTEGIFFCLAVWSFVFARRGKFIFSSVLILIAATTRILGLVLIAAILVEIIIQKQKVNQKIINSLITLGIGMAGFLGYLYFLQLRTGDPLEFLHSVELFGDQRSSTFILLPQVFYRYIFKILPNIGIYFPLVYVTFMEFLVAVLFLLLSVVGWFRLRKSYWVYMVGGYIMPTLSGSFSSLPRYVIILFPAFILMEILINQYLPKYKKIIYGLLFICLLISTMLFARGYWVS